MWKFYVKAQFLKMVRHTLKILQHLLQDGLSTFLAALNPQSWERKIVMGKNLRSQFIMQKDKRNTVYCYRTLMCKYINGALFYSYLFLFSKVNSCATFIFWRGKRKHQLWKKVKLDWKTKFSLVGKKISPNFRLQKLVTAEKMKFFIKDIFSKCDEIRSFLQIWSHILKTSLIKNFFWYSGFYHWSFKISLNCYQDVLHF